MVGNNPEAWGFREGLPNTTLELAGVIPLQRFFPSFPGGWRGVALLLLRIALGLPVVIQGSLYLREPGATVAGFAAGAVSVVSGSLVSAGLFTPYAGTAMAAECAAVWLALVPTPVLFHTVVSSMLAIAILQAVILLGPGAYSVDARLFGRREIIIPPAIPRND